MNDLEGRLDPARFVRIHRSIIVNLDGSKMHPHFNGDYIVVLGTADNCDSAALDASTWKRD